MALDCVLLVDLVHRTGSFDLFYTAEGVYPLAVHEATAGHAGRLSLHALSDRAAVQAALFALSGAFAAAFAVGYRTRLVGAVSLLLVVSLHIRTPVVLNGSDLGYIARTMEYEFLKPVYTGVSITCEWTVESRTEREDRYLLDNNVVYRDEGGTVVLEAHTSGLIRTDGG